MAAILTRWLKDDGEQVKVGEIICVIETDMAAVELAADESGVLIQLKNVGDQMGAFAAVARIDPDPGRPSA